MFTGIVQAMGTVRSIRSGSKGAHLVLDAPGLARPIDDGASVCVSGICLTVTASDDTRIEFDVVPATLAGSTLQSLAIGDRVNLELSLRAGDRLDGHIVQGHVDGTAVVGGVRRGGSEGDIWTFRVDRALTPYLVAKGSVAVDGVSLTILETGDETFSVALIPTTLDRTTLGSRHVGDRVNIETDILTRTVVATMERWRGHTTRPGITADMLHENGW